MEFLKPNKDELKLKHIAQYKSLYKFVRRSLIRKFGFLGAVLCGGNAVFFLTLFNGLESTQSRSFTDCKLHQNHSKSKKPQPAKRAVSYTALLSICCKFTEPQTAYPSEKTLKSLLNKELKKDFTDNDALTKFVMQKISEYITLRENSDSDVLSDKMGELFGEILKSYSPNNTNKENIRSMYKLGFYTGKWLYLANMLERVAKGNKKLNTVKAEKHSSNKAETETSIAMCKLLNKKMLLELSNISLSSGIDIIYNIIRYSMPKIITVFSEMLG